MLKTLAAKHQSTVSKIAAKHKATIDTPHGPRTCFEARIERPGKQPLVARFGGIPLAPERNAILTDHVPARPVTYTRTELITRLRRGRCELCHDPDKVQVHQVRKLAQLPTAPGQPPWAAVMARKRRKTLIVCRPCHDIIHHGTRREHGINQPESLVHRKVPAGFGGEPARQRTCNTGASPRGLPG